MRGGTALSDRVLVGEGGARDHCDVCHVEFQATLLATAGCNVIPLAVTDAKLLVAVPRLAWHRTLSCTTVFARQWLVQSGSN